MAHSYKTTFHTGRRTMERPQSGESLAVKPENGLKIMEQGTGSSELFDTGGSGY